MLACPVQLVVLGTGEPRYEQRLKAIAAAHPKAMAVVLAYDETLAHRIEAAADIFSCPLFEPRGLNPASCATARRRWCVRCYDSTAARRRRQRHRLCVPAPDAGELLAALRRAVALWYDQQRWQQVNAMPCPGFSWQQRHTLPAIV